MSLIHDPSAIRYSSTQQAYGQTWTLSKTEEDGTQVWKNREGQEAFVPKAAVEIRDAESRESMSFAPRVADWVFNGKDDSVFIPTNTFIAPVSGNQAPPKAVSIERSLGDSVERVIGATMSPVDRAIAMKRSALTGDITSSINTQGCSTGHVSSLEGNQSNRPKRIPKIGDQITIKDKDDRLQWNGKTWIPVRRVE